MFLTILDITSCLNVNDLQHIRDNPEIAWSIQKVVANNWLQVQVHSVDSFHTEFAINPQLNDIAEWNKTSNLEA